MKNHRMKQIISGMFVPSCMVFGTAVAQAKNVNNYALIVGVGEYSYTTRLPGTSHDMANATKIANSMGISNSEIVKLENTQATKDRIVAELSNIAKKVKPDSRVLIYFSGHGTRYLDNGVCTHAYMPYIASNKTPTSKEVLSESEVAKYVAEISQRSNKTVTFFDTCFSGGMMSTSASSSLATMTRSFDTANGLGIVSKYTKFGTTCSGDVAANWVRTRSFAPAMARLGTPTQNFVQIAAANYDEVAWQTQDKGGAATYSFTQCVTGQARDLNRSGAVSLDEVRACAQSKVGQVLQPINKYYNVNKYQTIQVRGSRNLIIGEENEQVAQADTADNSDQQQQQSVDPAIASLATLQDIYEQRDGRLSLNVKAPEQMVIGRDALKVSVKSDTDGYLYAVSLGSDGKSFYLLFPNKLDKNNLIKANTEYSFPRAGWNIKSRGPVGDNNILFVVSKSPKDENMFVNRAGAGGGAFAYTVSDMTARKQLIEFFTGTGEDTGGMAANLVTIKEVLP